MASAKPWEIPSERLMSLDDLRKNVELEASLYLPDMVYGVTSREHKMNFRVHPLSTMLSEHDRDVVGVSITLNDETKPYLFNSWSRSQLLSLLGTREKWFSRVPLERQAEELDARLHVIDGYNFRTMRALDSEFPLRFIRGLVSSEYSDIPNTNIMEAVVQRAPADAQVLRGPSGVSDKAFYAYIVSPSPITIPNTTFFAYPVVVVKNSEVGYSSLYVIPGILLRRYVRDEFVPVVLESRAVLKKIHRGTIDLPAKFEKAFTDCSAVWSDMSLKAPSLVSRHYLSEDEAISEMRKMLLGAHASSDFIESCVRMYKSSPRVHTALDIFESVSEMCAEEKDRDAQYDLGSIAGAVLFKLLF